MSLAHHPDEGAGRLHNVCAQAIDPVILINVDTKEILDANSYASGDRYAREQLVGMSELELHPKEELFMIASYSRD